MKYFNVLKIASSIDEAQMIISKATGKKVDQVTFSDGYRTISHGIITEEYEINGENNMISIFFRVKIIREETELMDY